MCKLAVLLCCSQRPLQLAEARLTGTEYVHDALRMQKDMEARQWLSMDMQKLAMHVALSVAL